MQAWLYEQAAPMRGKIEVDESYFDACRAKGKREHGAFGFGGRVRHLQTQRAGGAC